jgi:hypothetical protein
MRHGNQRWRERKAHYRNPDEQINPLRYAVAAIGSDKVAKAFVTEHHYSGTYPAARFRFGLYRAAALVGVAVFTVPPRDLVLTKVFGGAVPVAELTELGRFVLLDDVPGNGETWFAARAYELLRRDHGIRGVVSFSDPTPRTTTAGEQVFRGHLGSIYQALNGRYTGRGKARTLRLLPDGQVFSERAISKIRSLERGWRYAVDQLRRYGANDLAAAEDRACRDAWLTTWLTRLTRPLRHPGNHRYAWSIDRRCRRHLMPALPYPKNDGWMTGQEGTTDARP